MWLVPSGSRAPAGGGQSGRTSYGGTSRGGGRPNCRVQSAPGAEGLEGHAHRGGHYRGAAASVAGAGTMASQRDGHLRILQNFRAHRADYRPNTLQDSGNLGVVDLFTAEAHCTVHIRVPIVFPVPM